MKAKMFLFSRLLFGCVFVLWGATYVTHFHGRYQFYEFVPLFVAIFVSSILASLVVAARATSLSWAGLMATQLLALAMLFAFYFAL